jgi:CDP-diacylglycerol--serine O-phosphatidyltransferase
MRKIYILPNLITSGSLFCGMLAIFETFGANGDPRNACWLIVLAAILDVFDGAIARLTKSASAFGMHLDSLADLVAFGVAPALMAYHAYGEDTPRLAPTVCSLYALCGALRLARFNVQAAREERKSFLGLPIPGAALGVTGMVWVLSVSPDTSNAVIFARVCPPVMVVLAYLMVSNFTYFSFKQVSLVNREPFEILVTTVMIALTLFMLKQHLDIVLAVGAWGYIGVGAALAIRQRLPIILGRAPADGDQARTGAPPDTFRPRGE